MKTVFLLIFLTLTFLKAENDFQTLNPPLTKEMKDNQKEATVCKKPAIAEEKFDKTFRYGCFCGENYPNIKPAPLKPIDSLSYSKRKDLIAKYYKIKPYDTIDEACMKHDICYIYNGKDNQECNDAFYKQLQKIYDKFDKTKEGQKTGTKAWRCKILASDMASIFKTIFTAGDDISPTRFSIFAMITPFTLANKIFQKGALSFSERSGYPLPFEKCITPSH